jgi:hypothetical protein
MGIAKEREAAPQVRRLEDSEQIQNSDADVVLSARLRARATSLKVRKHYSRVYE